MNDLSQVNETGFNQQQRWALAILDKDSGVRLIPECPLSMKTAMHDLWRLGMADRTFDEITGVMSYKITDTGRQRAPEVLKRTEMHTQETHIDDELEVMQSLERGCWLWKNAREWRLGIGVRSHGSGRKVLGRTAKKVTADPRVTEVEVFQGPIYVLAH